MEVGDAPLEPDRAKDGSPVRERWDDCGSLDQPRNGAKGDAVSTPGSPLVSYAPFRGSPIWFLVPSAYALGYYLAPLQGLAFAFQEAGVGSTSEELV